jgi:hypothetical protein
VLSADTLRRVVQGLGRFLLDAVTRMADGYLRVSDRQWAPPGFLVQSE